MTNDPQNASDPKTANHHWFPFLRYQEQCKEEGKEATITNWLRSNGKLEHQLEYEAAKQNALNKKNEEVKSE